MWNYKKQINDYMTVVSDTANKEGEIWILGDIVDNAWWDDEVSPATVRDSLKEMGPVDTLNIRVNSDGGSVYAGNAIINILNNYRKKTGAKINAYVEGIAASMASNIIMVADKIYMASNSNLMIHKPLSYAFGNNVDFQRTALCLEKAEDTLVQNYMHRFNGTEQELRDMLLAETYLSAQEAMDWGFCDEITPAIEIAASAKGVVINNQKFMRDEIVARFSPGSPLAIASKSKQDKAAPKEGKTMYDYDSDLASFGIDEEKFRQLNVSAETALIIAKTSVNTVSPSANDIVISSQQIVDTLGAEQDADTILALAKAGANIDEKALDKAKAYDKLVSGAIDEALKCGVRAKGESFDETRWKKVLNTFDYQEILDQSKEWQEEAKVIFNAGRRLSNPYPGNTNKQFINPDDYNFS